MKTDSHNDKNLHSALLHSGSLSLALNVIGDPWALQIIKEAFFGVSRFQDFKQRLRITRQTLVLRLNHLTDQSIFYKKPVQHRRVVYEYHLTPKGRDLYPFLLMVWRWHKRWQLDESQLPSQLYHKTCGQFFHPKMVCGGCHQEFAYDDVGSQQGAGFSAENKIERRRARIVNELSELDENNLATVVLGDRWSILVLYAIMQRFHNYADLLDILHISGNVLSLRLKTLKSLSLLEQLPSQHDGRSFNYVITEKGKDIYPIIMTLMHWSDRWLAGAKGLSELRRHKSCKAILEPRVICSACGDYVRINDVEEHFSHSPLSAQ